MSELEQLIINTDSVAIFSKRISNKDGAFGISAIIQIIKDKGKSVLLVCPDGVSKTVQHIFQQYGVEINKNFSKSEYIVKIEYGNGRVDKIEYDTNKDEGTIEFKIFPKDSTFDFQNVKFLQNGITPSGIILIDFNNAKELGKIYDENENIFKNSEIVKVYSSQGLCSQLLRLKSFEENRIGFEILKEGIVEKIELFNGNDLWEICHNLNRNGFDVNKYLIDKYYSKPTNFLNLSIRIMQNVKFDKEKRRVWSIITPEELETYGLKIDDLAFTPRLLFNISIDFDLAFLFLLTNDGYTRVIIESNNTEKFSAETISKVFGGKGNEFKGSVDIKGLSLENMQKNFWNILEDLYPISKNYVAEIVDNLPKQLTKAHKNSKNRG